MACTVCGFEMKRGEKFCTRCGAGAGQDRLGGAHPHPAPPEPAQTPQQPAHPALPVDAAGIHFSNDTNIVVKNMPGGADISPVALASIIREAGIDISPEMLSEAMRNGHVNSDTGSVKFNLNFVKKEEHGGESRVVVQKSFTFNKTLDLKKLLYAVIGAAVAAAAAMIAAAMLRGR